MSEKPVTQEELSLLASDITTKERKIMEDFLKRHSIDPTYDEEQVCGMGK